MPTSLTEMLTEARRYQEVLAAWDGGTCRIERYNGLTHPTMHLWLYSNDKPTSLSIWCVTPIRICGPFGWAGCALRVGAKEYAARNWPASVNVFELSDGTVDFCLTCCHMKVQDGGLAPHWVQRKRRETGPEPF